MCISFGLLNFVSLHDRPDTQRLSSKDSCLIVVGSELIRHRYILVNFLVFRAERINCSIDPAKCQENVSWLS